MGPRQFLQSVFYRRLEQRQKRLIGRVLRNASSVRQAQISQGKFDSGFPIERSERIGDQLAIRFGKQRANGTARSRACIRQLKVDLVDAIAKKVHGHKKTPTRICFE